MRIIPVHNGFVFIPIGRTTDVAILDIDVVLLIGFERDDSSLFYGSNAKEGVPATLAGPVVNDKLAINI